MRALTKVHFLLLCTACCFFLSSFARRVKASQKNGAMTKVKALQKKGNCHRSQLDNIKQWQAAHIHEAIPMKKKCQLCLQASDSDSDCKFCPGGGAVRDDVAATCFSVKGNAWSLKSRCDSDFAVDLEQCNHVLQSPEGWDRKQESFIKDCRAIAGSGSAHLSQDRARDLECHWANGKRLAWFHGDQLNRGGHTFSLYTSEEIALDLSTGLACTKVSSRNSPLCGEGKYQLWQQDDPMAWVEVLVVGQFSCAGFFMTDSANKHLYATHANVGVLDRLPSEIIRELKWKDADGRDVSMEDVVVTYVVGANSTYGGVPDDGSRDEIRKLLKDGIRAQNIHIGMHRGNGVGQSQLTLLRNADSQWNAYWGGA